MINITNFKQLGDDIYVYNNFVSQQELKEIQGYAKSLSENDWYEQEPNIKWMIRTDNTNVLNSIRNKIVSLVSGDLVVGSSTAIIKMKKGYSWRIHQDDYDFKDVINKSKSYVEGQPFELVDISKYGLVAYLNEFDGGEIYYPKQNIEYKPFAGDLVIHGSDEKCQHGVKEVLSEFRLSYSNHISTKIKVPK
jgi:hypothetical protein